MASFDIAYPLTVSNEGYYVSQDYWRSHGDNNSGETYMGIDRIANPNWAGWPIIDKYKAQNGTPAYNFRFPVSLGLEDLVKQSAKTKYWDANRIGEINNQQIANMVFEQVWGGYGGVKRFQQVMNTMLPSPISVDGGIGKDTLSAFNSLPQDDLYQALWNDRKNWIQTVGAKFAPKDVSGWLSRLDRFKTSISDDISAVGTSINASVGGGISQVQVAFKKNPVILFAGAGLILLGIGAIFMYTRQQNTANA